MTRGKRLQIACLVLVISQFSILKSAAQSALLNTLDREPDLETRDVIPRALSTVNLAEESKPSSLPKAPSYVPRLITLSSEDPGKFGPLDTAYLDAFTILRTENPCSAFFGGPFAIAALNELVQQLKPRFLDKKIAIRMSGKTTLIESHLTGFRFRSFEKAEVNLDGLFFREGRRPVANGFRANMRETRVVVLLHELGHMVKNKEKQWVLPDDGSSPSLSVQNSEAVVSVCRQEIKALSGMSHAQEFELVAKKESVGRTQ